MWQFHKKSSILVDDSPGVNFKRHLSFIFSLATTCTVNSYLTVIDPLMYVNTLTWLVKFFARTVNINHSLTSDWLFAFVITPKYKRGLGSFPRHQQKMMSKIVCLMVFIFQVASFPLPLSDDLNRGAFYRVMSKRVSGEFYDESWLSKFLHKCLGKVLVVINN